VRYSLRDPVTQLPNRTAFIHRVDLELERVRAGKYPAVAVVCVDIDRFKVLNESLGQALGDEFLAGAAERMVRVIGREGTLARLGADTFALLLARFHSDAVAEATAIAGLIQEELRRHVLVGRRDVNASASMGLAVVSGDCESAEEALRDAEIAMYRAKEQGGGRLEISDEKMRARTRNLLALEMDLRQALERQEFELFYQPIVSARTGGFAAFEALIRWRHPERGLLSPDVFLKLLDDTGLIVPVGRWVIAEACLQASRWELACGRIVPVSFNLCAKEFKDPCVASVILEAISIAGVEPSAMTIELTEDALIDPSGAVAQTLATLSDSGLRLLIDDFGTGYSSLSYLGRLPAHGLKIPRELVSRIHTSSQDRAVVRAIRALALSLKLDVVAEGVENVEQLAELREIDCDLIQGYLVSPPVDACAAGKLLAGEWALPECQPNHEGRAQLSTA
jgi:diguanylate cyclase (GGDEF)-like protein